MIGKFTARPLPQTARGMTNPVSDTSHHSLADFSSLCVRIWAAARRRAVMSIGFGEGFELDQDLVSQLQAAENHIRAPHHARQYIT